MILLFSLLPLSGLRGQSILYTPFLPVSQRNVREIVLDNGVYDVLVKYRSNTGREATYKLKVYIKNDTVERIYFDNGGSLHSGYNNSSYTYRGGGIEFRRDFRGNIVGGEARVQVNYSGGQWQYFVIYL